MGDWQFPSALDPVTDLSRGITATHPAVEWDRDGQTGVPAFSVELPGGPSENSGGLEVPDTDFGNGGEYSFSFWFKLKEDALIPDFQEYLGFGGEWFGSEVPEVQTLLAIGDIQPSGNPLVDSLGVPRIPKFHWCIKPVLTTNTPTRKQWHYYLVLEEHRIVGANNQYERYEVERWPLIHRLSNSQEIGHDDGEWHQMVLTISPSSVEAYIDGELLPPEVDPVVVPPATFYYTSETSQTYCTLGTIRPDSSSTPRGYSVPPIPLYEEGFPHITQLEDFNGGLDRFRVYNRILTGTEAQLLYDTDIDRDGLFDRNESRNWLWRDINGDGQRPFHLFGEGQISPEVSYVARPFYHDPDLVDHDDDGLTSLLEQTIGSDLADYDSDGDSIPDGWEFFNLGVSHVTAQNFPNADADGDGLSDIEEYHWNTDPHNPDSDGDNISDGTEVSNGGFPNNAIDGGIPPTSENSFVINVTAGDHSGSESESYEVNIFELDPETYEENRIRTPILGQITQNPTAQPVVLPKGATYTFQLKWLESSNESGNGEGPDFDYTFQLEEVGGTPYSFVEPWDPVCRCETGEDSILGIYEDQGSFVQLVQNRRVVRPTVRVEVNNTATQDDDLVAVSAGTDDDLATRVTIKSVGMAGKIVNLSLKNNDGNIKFENQALTLDQNGEAETQIWGITPSTDKDKTVLVAELMNGGQIAATAEEDLTVFEGVEMEFEGNFYINVDTREFSRRPWDGRVDPKPNSKGSLTGKTAFMDAEIGSSPAAGVLNKYKKAVDQSLSFGYQSAISFKDNDNSDIPSYKPWKDPLEVKITSISSINPSFLIVGDPAIGAQLAMESGVLNGLPDGQEKLLDPIILIGTYAKLENATLVKRIQQQASVVPGPVLATAVKAQIAAARTPNGPYEELLDYYNGDFQPNGLDRSPGFAGFSGANYKWENDSFGFKKEADLSDSIAIKALLGAKENGGKIEASWVFSEWNEFKFQGVLNDGKIKNK